MAVDAISGVPGDVTSVTIPGQDVQTPVEIFARKEAADIPAMKQQQQKQQQQKAPELNKEELEKLTQNLNHLLDSFDIAARFSVHEVTKDIMVRIYNSKTNETIREFPPKKILDMVANMMKLVGLLLDEKA